MRKPIAIGIAAALATALAGVAPAQANDSRNGDNNGDAELTFFNGLTDRTVDVYIDGDLEFDDVDPGDFENSLEVDAGDSDVAITKSDSRSDKWPLVKLDVDFEDGEEYTLVAHFDEDGDKDATLFTNDTSSVNGDDGVLTVRHVAEADEVDVRVDGEKEISSLANGEEDSATLEADSYEVKVTEAGEWRALIGPEDVDVDRHTNTIVYAWGDEDNLELATEEVELDRH